MNRPSMSLAKVRAARAQEEEAALKKKVAADRRRETRERNEMLAIEHKMAEVRAERQQSAYPQLDDKSLINEVHKRMIAARKATSKEKALHLHTKKMERLAAIGHIEYKPAVSGNVFMSNDLARAAQDLTLKEKRLVMLAAAKLSTECWDPEQKTVKVDLTGYQVKLTAKEISESLRITYNAAYETLESVTTLFDRVVKFRNTEKGTGVQYARWVISRSAVADGEVSIDFHPDIIPHLANLKRRFTLYSILDCDFDKYCTWRLFDMLMSWRSDQFMAVSAEDIKAAMDIDPEDKTSIYNRDFGAFMRIYIEPAVKEINEKFKHHPLKMLVRCSKLISGRKITGLQFSFDIAEKMPRVM